MKVRQTISVVCLMAANDFAQPSHYDVPMFHLDRERTGWQQNETTLTPANVSPLTFGHLWDSLPFEVVNGNVPHAYGSPLYLESVTITATYTGTFSVLYSATSTGELYAVNAFSTQAATGPVPAGTVLWKARLSVPTTNTNSDGVPLGCLSTPVIDNSLSPPVIYLACADAVAGWEVFALNATNGSILPGWPVQINNTVLASVNQNGPAVFQPTSAMSQRGALNLSPDGTLLYVPFGGYIDSAAGWLVAINTASATIASAFSGAPSSSGVDAGMWAASGVAIDSAGNTYVTTGNGSTGNDTTPGYWGNSLLAFQPGIPLKLSGTYTPFNHCLMDLGDVDVGGSGPMTTPQGFLVFGAKNGNAYLLNSSQLPGSLTARQACTTDASTDKSLLPPGIQQQFGTLGPLNVFGPYSEGNNNLNYAKLRSTAAYFKDTAANEYVFTTGSNKSSVSSEVTVAPGICRLKIVTSFGSSAYLAVDTCDNTLTLNTPGSPIVSSNGSSNAVGWVLVANIPRSQRLDQASQPFLVAVDAMSSPLKVLWKSNLGDLFTGGKYNTPVIAHGTVWVATDRIQAFGLLPPPAPPPPAPAPTAFSMNSCGPSIGSFVAEVYESGGNCTVTAKTPVVTGVANAAPLQVYKTKRTGQNGTGFTYTIPRTVTQVSCNPQCTVRLHFADDLFASVGARVFNVAVNGVVALSNFDIFKAAGQVFKAVVQDILNVSPNANGQIVIQGLYVNSNQNPLIDGLELIPQSGVSTSSPVIAFFTASPASIVSGGQATLLWNVTGATSLLISGVGSVNPVSSGSVVVSPIATTVYILTATNNAGSVTAMATVTATTAPSVVPLRLAVNSCGPLVGNFVAEIDETGGNCTTVNGLSVNVAGVTNAAPAPVYSTKRTGNTGKGVGFSYAFLVPVIPGQLYTVRLHFADDLYKGTGQRVFNVAVNGVVALANFDVAAAAGNQKFTAVVRDIENVSPNTASQIVIQGLYVNANQNPLVSGLEIIPQ